MNSDQRRAMLLQALTSSTAMYDDNRKILGLLEDKAHKTAGLAGLFLAAAFGFLRKDNIADLLAATGKFGLVLLCVAIALFLLSVTISILVLLARSYKGPPHPDGVLHMCDLLLSKPGGPTDEEGENYIRDLARQWNVAVKSQGPRLAAKSQALLSAHIVLYVAMAVVSVLLIELVTSSVFGPATTHPVGQTSSKVDPIKNPERTKDGKMH